MLEICFFLNDNDRYTSFARSIKLLNVSRERLTMHQLHSVYIYIYNILPSILVIFSLKLKCFIERHALFPSTVHNDD